jgi:deferrochelatase/peroxidase EfeB
VRKDQRAASLDHLTGLSAFIWLTFVREPLLMDREPKWRSEDMKTDFANIERIEPHKYKELLDDLQGNILKGHGREQVRLLLIEFTGGKAEAREWIHAFGRGWVTSASRQTEQTVDYLARKQEALFANLFLTCRGYQYIGVPDERIPADPRFRAGMLESRSILNDPPGNEWDPPYDTAHPIHAMVLLAASMAAVLEKGASNVVESLLRPIADTPPFAKTAPIAKVRQQDGNVLKELATKEGARGRYVEHLNYLDGRSQPLFFRDDLDDEEDWDGIGEYDPSAPLGLVLVKEPNGGPNRCGSYLVYRKLEQDVRGFKERERKAGADAKSSSVADRLRLVGEESRKRVGAMVIGRFENGTPIALAARSSLRSAPNNFNYSDDPKGLKCPLFAHIRKVNQRTEESRSRRIVRRGITYDDIGRTAPPSDAGQTYEQMPAHGVGLLFMCFQSSIKDQFEYLQIAANDPDWPVPGAGIDPLIGQSGEDPGVKHRWPKEWGRVGALKMQFGNFVRLKEGEYFFAPSRSFFRGLGGSAE